MSLNIKKVENYTRERIEKEYRAYYPKEIFEGLTVATFGGSFGSCLLSLRYDNGNPHNLRELDCVYVANYKDVDTKISRFIIRNYDLLASRCFEKHRKEKSKGMRCVLQIFNNNELVNAFDITEPEDVKNELAKIVISEKRRGTKTTWKPIPYSNDLRIIQKWKREQIGTTCDIKYIYHFYNLDY